MRIVVAAGLLGILFGAGCSTQNQYRSADFTGDKVYHKGAATAPQLTENEVLGLHPGKNTSDADIRRILDEGRTFHIQSGSRVLLVQSGSAYPDNAMVRELEHHFTVLPHTGVPRELRENNSDVAKALRLAAAHSKAETILVYWGNLELKRNDLPTSIVSWVPVVDFAVPDEYQKVRMHLKVALIDVRSGHWATFRTEAIEEEGLTTRYGRERQPGWQLERSKQRLYQAAVKKLADGYLASGGEKLNRS